MVYNEWKTLWTNGWFGGYHYLWKHPYIHTMESQCVFEVFVGCWCTCQRLKFGVCRLVNLPKGCLLPSALEDFTQNYCHRMRLSDSLMGFPSVNTYVTHNTYTYIMTFLHIDIYIYKYVYLLGEYRYIVTSTNLPKVWPLQGWHHRVDQSAITGCNFYTFGS